MRMNRRMISRLNQSDPADFAESKKLSKGLSQLLTRGFATLDQAIVYAALHKLATNVKPENFPDLTGCDRGLGIHSSISWRD